MPDIIMSLKCIHEMLKLQQNIYFLPQCIALFMSKAKYMTIMYSTKNLPIVLECLHFLSLLET